MHILRFFIHGNLFIAFAAWCMCRETYLLLNMPADSMVPAFAGFSTLFVYNLHRVNIVTGKQDLLTADRHRWMQGHKALVYLLMAAGLAGMAFTAGRLPEDAWFVLLPAGAIALAYSLPGGQRKGLRYIRFLKLFLIAAVWTLATTTLPAAGRYDGHSGELCWLTAERFLFILAITIPFDIRDLHIDRDAGILTLPASLGMRTARLLAVTATGLFTLTVLLHYMATGLYSGGEITALVLSAIFAGVLAGKADSNKGELYYTGWLDATMVVQFILVYVASLIE